MTLAVAKSLEALKPEMPGAAVVEPMRTVPGTASGGMEALSGGLEPRYALLLRTLLDASDADPRLSGAPATLQRAGLVLEVLRRDIRLVFAEFREKWATRLDAAALVHFLERNQWFVPHARGGVGLTGKGTRPEARQLYLQTLHDMASDCARQWASLGGRLQALQGAFAEDWHREAISDNGSRILPVLEAALRGSEFEAWKSMRLSLGDRAEEAFVRAVSRWENRNFPDAPSLVRGIAAPWCRLDPPGRNGFIGFMRVFSRLAENLALAMADHYDRKWELFLRGFSAPGARA